MSLAGRAVATFTYPGPGLGLVEASTIYTSWTADPAYVTDWKADRAYTSWTARGVRV
jgi:hypothetical protein